MGTGSCLLRGAGQVPVAQAQLDYLPRRARAAVALTGIVTVPAHLGLVHLRWHAPRVSHPPPCRLHARTFPLLPALHPTLACTAAARIGTGTVPPHPALAVPPEVPLALTGHPRDQRPAAAPLVIALGGVTLTPSAMASWPSMPTSWSLSASTLGAWCPTSHPSTLSSCVPLLQHPWPSCPWQRPSSSTPLSLAAP
jgi:hypothetical protein